jgi:hypothetical protein
MIISNKVQIIINSSNIRHYKKFYSDIKIKDKIEVNINELTKGTKYKIKMMCDECQSIINIPYNVLYKNNNLNNFICSKCKRKKTILNKYGVENVFQLDSVKEKSKTLIYKKYGVENVSQNEEIKRKKSETFIKKYGVNWGLSSEIIKEKSKNTIIEKYGVNNVSQNEEIKKKKEITCLKNHGVNYISQHKDFRKNIEKINLIKLQKKYKNLLNINGDNFTFFCEKCNQNFEIYKKAFYSRYNLNVNLCTLCNPINSYHTSGLEENLFNFIFENTESKIIKNNKKIINPYELDIYIEELKLAFEFNGLFWHNENNLHKNYHLRKTEMCEEKGIQLIHIYEDDWLNKQEIIKSMIINKLGKTKNKIYSRKCVIKEINNNKLVREFLDKNHIQGFIGSKFKIGLFYNNELISIMSFGYRRVSMGKKTTKNDEYELLRFCNKINTNVIGGASKLLNYFIKNYKPSEIITYADRSFSQGDLYRKLRFKFISKTQPNYYYIINSVRKHRFNFRKDKLVKDGYDKNKTEHDIMLGRHIFRIYDSGNLKFKLNL